MVLPCLQACPDFLLNQQGGWRSSSSTRGPEHSPVPQWLAQSHALGNTGQQGLGIMSTKVPCPAWAPTPKNLFRNNTGVTPHPPATITDKMQDFWVSPRGSKHSNDYNMLINCSDSIHALFLSRIKSDYYAKFSLIQQMWPPKNFNARNVLAHSPLIVVGCFQERLGHTWDIQPTVTCKMQDSSEVYLSLCTSHCIETFII